MSDQGSPESNEISPKGFASRKVCMFTPGRTLAGLCVLSVCLAFFLGELLLFLLVGAEAVTPTRSIVEAVKLSYTGGHETNQLEHKLNSEMRVFLPSREDRAAISGWISRDAMEHEYDMVVMPIINSHCASCHGPEGAASFARLTSYQEVRAMAHRAPGPSLPQQVQFTKIHVGGIGLLLAVLATATIYLSRGGTRFTTLMVVFAMGGLVLDFLAYFSMRITLDFAYARLLGHALMGTGALGLVAEGVWSFLSPREKA